MANRYWVGGAGNWNDAAHWSATSGGTGGASVPTAADNVTFDANSGTGTVTVNAVANMLDLTFTQTQLITLANAAYPFNIYGNWTLCSDTYLNTSFTGTGYVYLKATTSVNITSNGCTRAWNRLYFDGVGGTWTNQDDFDINPSIPYLKNGHWNTNSKSINTSGLAIDAGVKMLTLGNSIFNGNAGAMYFHFNTSGMTLNAGTSTIINNNIYNGTGFYGGPYTFYNVIVSAYAQGYASGNSIFNNLTINYSPSGSHIGIVLESGSGIITINNNFTINGYNSSTRRLLIASNIIGTALTITCNGTVTASNVDFRDIVLAGTCNKDLSAITGGSGDCGGNSGIIFTPAQTQYFKHTSGAVNWSDTTKWFSNQAKTVQGRMPLPQDDAVFDAGSFTGASTMSINVPRIGRNKDFSAINQAVGIVLQNAVQTYGGWHFSLLNTISGNYLIQFDGHGRIFSEKVYLGVMSYFANNLDILGNNTFSEIVINAGCKIRMTSGTTQNIGKLTAIGTPAAPITIGSTTTGQRHTLNYTGNEASTVKYCNISDSKVTEARRLLAKNSVNAGNNQNWGFDTLPSLALNKKQVDKMYVGDKLVTAIYKGTNKIY